MKKTISLSEFRDGFHYGNRKDQFGYYALEELFDYYTRLEEDCDIEIEFDVIAICCEWTEYTEEEFISNFSYLLSWSDYMEMEEISYDDYEDRQEALIELKEIEYPKALIEEVRSHTEILEVTNIIDYSSMSAQITYLVMDF